MVLHHTIDNGTGEWARWIRKGESIYWCDSSFVEKGIPKEAGFTWHRDGKKVWFTGDKDRAAKLVDYAVDGNAEWAKELSAIKIGAAASLVGSRQSVSYSDFPHPEGMDYFPFQKAGVEYLAARQNALLADEPGLGKTIQVLGLINTDTTIKKVLVICPKTLCLNWQREAEKWLVRPVKIGIATPKLVPECDFMITNFETVGKINGQLSGIEWDLLCIDEAHFLKNKKTIRYRSIMGDSVRSKNEKKYDRIPAKRKVFATGTPICNRPAELWPLISAVDPDKWNEKSFWYYHKRYCNATQTRYGMDFSGAASPEKLSELQVILRERCMIRRLKSKVLTDLPPKIRQVVELEYDEDDGAVCAALTHEREYQDRVSGGMDEAQAKLELAKASDNDSDYAAAIAKVGEENSFAFEEMARVRKETVEAKLPYAIEYIKEQLETLPKVVVFAHHHLAIEGFAKAFPLESVSIYGEIRPEDRQKAIDRFQNDPNCRIAIVSIMAGGVGITLTAASHVYFIELDWVPGNVTQCEDRCHRIGQQDAVNVYHLVLRGSIDVKMANTIISKQKIIEAALDKIMEREPVTLSGEGATKKSSRKAISEEAEMLTAGDIESIHADLKFLAEHDQDHAQFQNGIGFNAIDGRIGHELAERQRLTAKQAALGKMILRKYKRQLGKDDEK